MMGKLAKWAVISLLVLVLITATAALALSEAYGRVKTDRGYRRDTEASLRIGRFSEGIDHKGRRTGKIIR